MDKIIIITILNLLILPNIALADIVVENSNSSTVTNSLEIVVDSCSNISQNNFEGETSVDLNIETIVNGEKLIDKKIIESSEDGIDLSYKSSLEINHDSEPQIEEELIIQPTEDNQDLDQKPSLEDEPKVSSDTASQVSSKEVVPLIIKENVSEETVVTETANEEEVNVETAEPQVCDFTCSSAENENKAEETQAEPKTETNNFNILVTIANYFVNIFSKFVKIFT